MTQRLHQPRSYSFEPPRWRTPDQVNLWTGVLLIGSLLWTVGYVWLGLRLWRQGLHFADPLTWGATLLCIVSGVMVGLGWWWLWPRWRARLPDLTGKSDWPALTLQESQQLSPSDFEAYVAYRLFARQGYRVENTRDTKDGGVDVAVYDRVGQLAVVQCKRYRGTVGEATVRDLYGTMIHAGAVRSYLITTGRISREAREWAVGKSMGLIDGARLAELARAEPPRDDADAHPGLLIWPE